MIIPAVQEMERRGRMPRRDRYYNIQPYRFSWTAYRSPDWDKKVVQRRPEIETHRIGPARSLGVLAPAR